MPDPVAKKRTVREAVGVFDDVAGFEEAIDELLKSGFERSDINLLASEKAVAEKLGHRYARVEELEDDPTVPRVAYTERKALGEAEGVMVGSLTYLPALLAAGVVVGSAGAAVAAITAAAIGGAVLSTALGHWMDRRHAEYLQAQLEHGGHLLWVRTRDAEAERRAVEILSRHSAHDVHVHELPLRAAG